MLRVWMKINVATLGNGVVLLRYLSWLNNMPIVYWGDLDLEGFEILSSLRTVYRHCKYLVVSFWGGNFLIFSLQKRLDRYRVEIERKLEMAKK